MLRLYDQVNPLVTHFHDAMHRARASSRYVALPETNRPRDADSLSTNSRVRNQFAPGSHIGTPCDHDRGPVWVLGLRHGILAETTRGNLIST